MSPVRLTLSVRNVDRLDNGMPVSVEFVQRNAIIGRSPAADWCLPDPHAYISSHHCEISYTPAGYVISDRSTNGTYLNGNPKRLEKPHLIESGDHFAIGHYEIVATLEGGAIAEQEAPPPGWKGWEAPPPPPPVSPPGWDSPPSPGGWGSAQPPLARSDDTPQPGGEPGWGAPQVPPSSGWGPPSPPVPSSVWDTPPAAVDPASPWSSAASDTPGAATAEGVWGKLASSYDVDWRRGGFQPEDPPAASIHDSAFAPPLVAPSPDPVARPPAVPAPPAPVASASAKSAGPSAGIDPAAMEAFFRAAGLDPAALRGREAETLISAGGLLRRLVAGMVVMLEARARAKSQMGVRTTIFSRAGNNPLKFARSPEGALLQLLKPLADGSMPGDQAVEDGFRDLHTHQLATLKAMQGALRATLDRFSPEAVRKRAEAGGKAGGLLPGSREAALWRAYQRDFSGVAQGSDEAFMEVFSREFKRAYEAQGTSVPRP